MINMSDKEIIDALCEISISFTSAKQDAIIPIDGQFKQTTINAMRRHFKIGGKIENLNREYVGD